MGFHFHKKEKKAYESRICRNSNFYIVYVINKTEEKISLIAQISTHSAQIKITFRIHCVRSFLYFFKKL